MYKINFDEAMEIRLSCGRPVSVTYSDGIYYLSSAGYLTKSSKGSIKINRIHLEEALEIATNSSIYNREQSICEGFITASGGHRIFYVTRNVPRYRDYYYTGTFLVT